MVRIGMIGAGNIANTHIASYKKNPNVEIAAICDINPERLKETADKFGIEKRYASAAEMLASEKLDAADVCVWNCSHAECTIAALQAGLDVLCEKPMALTVEECTEMRRVEKETGRRLMIGQVCRYTDAFVMAKQLIDSGRIGELYFVESEYAHDYSKKPGYNGWRVCPEREGFIGGGCHAVDLLRWIAGNPTEVYAHATPHRLACKRCDDRDLQVPE